jgi:pimeloyl-ACP methyl ester carboxylesterase
MALLRTARRSGLCVTGGVTTSRLATGTRRPRSSSTSTTVGDPFAAWPAARRDAFLEDQRTRGDLWDVLFDAPITVGSLASVAVPVHVIEGSATSVVDRAICDAVLRNLRHARRSVIEGAGHMMPLSHAADLTRVLLRHLGRD